MGADGGGIAPATNEFEFVEMRVADHETELIRSAVCCSHCAGDGRLRCARTAFAEPSN